jgi:DNA-binding transcriptional ArsR family regulator
MDAAALRVVAAPRRQAILRLVWDAELCAGDIHAALGDVTFGAVSQHLAVLEASGLVERRVLGRQRLYRARPDALGPLRAWLEDMWADALYELKLRAELEESRRGPRSQRHTKRHAKTRKQTKKEIPR